MAQALADGVVSPSWARELCRWTDLLPEPVRGDADVLLLAARAGGLELADLARLAEEIRRRTATPDTDTGDGGFTDRYLSLTTTIGRAGVLRGELTPQCAFHHLIAIHRWGWTISLQPDGTVTATNPDHTRIHGPPLQAA